jgi:hypothetical protein
VGAHQFVTVQPDPDDGYLRAPVGVDGGEVGRRSSLDEFAKFKRDLVETLSSDGIHLRFGEAPIVRSLVDVLAELLGRAQRAGAVRNDIGVDDVMALLTGAAYSICHSRADDDQTRRLLAISPDGLREHRSPRSPAWFDGEQSDRP